MNLLMQFSEYCLLLIKYGISIKVVWPEMFSLSCAAADAFIIAKAV